MNTQSILDEVERQVAERLPGVLLEKGIKVHAKRYYRLGCKCAYCVIKREATIRIGSLPAGTCIDTLGLSYEERGEYREKIRNELRIVWRAKIKAAFTEVYYP
jgi:hypothetical protein